MRSSHLLVLQIPDHGLELRLCFAGRIDDAVAEVLLDVAVTKRSEL